MSLLIGMAGIFGSLYFIFTYQSPGYQGYFDLPSMVLLGIAPPSIMLLSHTAADFLTGIRLLIGSMFSRGRRNHMEVIEALTVASKAVRSDGLGAVIPIRDKARYDLLRDGLSLIINDFKPEEIKHNLMARVNQKQSHMALASSLFENMSKICPGIGMIGTLLGLITMMANMSDPTKLGTGMALAMITTLYGLLLGTIIYAPWGEKIALEAEKSLEIDLLVVDGILNIKGKKSSAHIKDLLKSYAGAARGKEEAAQGKKGA
jgi:chemotaxis protein MotA